MLASSGECDLCGGRLKKFGRTAAGTQRLRCTDCGATSSIKRRRGDVARRHELEAFLTWLTGKHTQEEAAKKAGISGRSFRRRTAWCWNIRPRIPVTGEIYDQIQLDGIYIGSWCCLIAISPTGVIGYQWCDTEKRAAWEELLKRFPAPAVVINDGGAGLLSARKYLWPKTRVQRCLVHLQRTVRRHITTRPRTIPGKELRQLSLALTKINTTEQAASWLAALADFHQRHRGFIFARTRRDDHAGPVPGWVRPGQKSWFTHDRLRKAYVLLERCAKHGELFTYLDGDLDFEIASTTNQIEGGINAQIRLLLRHHRGLPEEHMRRAVEWFLYLRSEDPQAPHQLIEEHHYQPKPKPQVLREEPLGPQLDGHAATAEEGLWGRSGWGGRSH
ncbi:IS1249 family transposase [Nesterenkonia sp. MY13]|uniref:IS1249 family transposase n=1 Tax=Nesterenkonia sedimenti TaxID=1463632 RepID=A0A7X8TLA1_9MICC|nr:IS1249 family transposase [Nesterenkonia sedimenti]NLS10880.1 IS1249 family transposase [Nesterenkonia sedimenti]